MTITAKKRKNGEIYGYWVRWDFRTDHKPKFNAQFNAKDFGGLKNALIAAQNYEKGLQIGTGYDPIEHRANLDRAKPNKKSKSKTGIPGVHFVSRMRQTKNGTWYLQEHFVASWQIGKFKQKKKQFSLQKWGGIEGAFAEATKHRKEMLDQYYYSKIKTKRDKL